MKLIALEPLLFLFIVPLHVVKASARTIAHDAAVAERTRSSFLSSTTEKPIEIPESCSVHSSVNLQKQAVIEGDETHIVTITLHPNETIRAQPNTIIYRTDDIDMKTSIPPGAGKRFLTGTPLFQIDYTYRGKEKGTVALGKRNPSKMLRINLDEHGGLINIRKGALMVSNAGVKVGVKTAPTWKTAFFGGQGFILQTLSGRGDVLLSSGGTQIRKDLKEGESLFIEPDSLVAYTNDIQYSTSKSTGAMNVVFGDERWIQTKLTGPGTVWLQGLHPRFFQKRIHTHSESSSSSSSSKSGSSSSSSRSSSSKTT